MTRSIYGRINLDDGAFADTRINIADNGWVYVEASGRWYPPARVLYIKPADDRPEREY